MEIIAALGGGSFVLSSFVTGLRLVILSGRTRELPEFFLGMGLLLMGGLGYPLTMLGEFGKLLTDDTRSLFIAANQLCGVVGLSLLAAFTWKVFRREDRIAQIAFFAVAAGFVGSFVWRAIFLGFTPIALGGAQAPALHTLLSWGVLTWSGTESLRYHLQLRKRLGLGLADPIVVDRFRLWASGMLVAMLLSAISSICNYLGIPFNTTTVGILTVGVLGSICAGCIWCAFFPPAGYVRWIRARAVSTGEQSA